MKDTRFQPDTKSKILLKLMTNVFGKLVKACLFVLLNICMQYWKQETVRMKERLSFLEEAQRLTQIINLREAC